MTELRYERKYLLDLADYRQIRSELLLHPCGLKTQHPDRKINNIYFDTHDLNALQTNLFGVQERSKNRLRWYGKAKLPTGNARWETKMKLNMLGTKSVVVVNIPEGASITQIGQLVNRHVDRTAQLIPVLLNSYNRSYFISADGKFRFTIDRDLEFTTITAGRKTSQRPFESRHVIVELKYDREWDDDVSEILTYLTLRQTKNSKYVTGMLTTP